jgi:hypothetical protein|tara:strand:+ start:174 stop:371 length:198 start_codon:yes stop_codon:yes gene_type:complete
MNISEFERLKPRKTFEAIDFAIDKYEGYIREIDPIMDEADASFVELSQEILDDLNRIKNFFLEGL